MAVRSIGSILTGLVDAVFRPHRFVAVQTNTYSTSRLAALRQMADLSVIYLTNLAAYALPLTLAGIGVRTSAAVPAAFAGLVGGYVPNPAPLWRLLVGFGQNSLFITIATVVTLVTYHVGVVLTRNSRGLLQSMHTVVYTTSAYLAAIFSGVWFLTTNEGVAAAREFVRALQAKFVYAIIDFLGADVGLPSGRPGEITVSTFSTTGQWVLVLLVVSAVYYFLSLYFGARINHQMGRSSAVLAVLAVFLSPILYVAGSVILATTTIP